MLWISSALGFPGIDSISLLKLSLIVPKAPTTTATTFVLTFHILEISICRSLYFNLISVSFFNTFTSPVIATSTTKQFFSFLFRIIKSGLFARVVLSVDIVLSHIMTLSSIFVTFSDSCIIILFCHWEIKIFANSPVYVARHLVVPLQVLHWCKNFTSSNYVTDVLLGF